MIAQNHVDEIVAAVHRIAGTGRSRLVWNQRHICVCWEKNSGRILLQLSPQSQTNLGQVSQHLVQQIFEYLQGWNSKILVSIQ